MQQQACAAGGSEQSLSRQRVGWAQCTQTGETYLSLPWGRAGVSAHYLAGDLVSESASAAIKIF